MWIYLHSFFHLWFSCPRAFYFSTDTTPWNCQAIAVIMKNDILATMGYYQGTYQISETVNGNPSWKTSAKAIWHSSDINAWVIGKFFIMLTEFDKNQFKLKP